MRVALDVTPLLGPRTGIGTYTAHVVDGVVATLGPEQVVAVAIGRRSPAELAGHMRGAGLRLADIAGMAPDTLRGGWRATRDVSVNYVAMGVDG